MVVSYHFLCRSVLEIKDVKCMCQTGCLAKIHAQARQRALQWKLHATRLLQKLQRCLSWTLERKLGMLVYSHSLTGQFCQWEMEQKSSIMSIPYYHGRSFCFPIPVTSGPKYVNLPYLYSNSAIENHRIVVIRVTTPLEDVPQ